MVNAPRHAQTLGVAGHAVRHLAAAPNQTRRPCRRTENPSQDTPAVQRPRSGDLSPCCSTACRVWSPETRGVMPLSPPLPATFSADPFPDNQPAAAGSNNPCRPLTTATKPRTLRFTVHLYTLLAHRSG